MHHRSIAILAIVFIAFGGGGCASKSNREYEEVVMPMQTGSVLQRRVLVRTDREKSPKKKKKKEKDASTSKPKTEPSATPAPDEESTPPVDRFR